MSHTAKLTAEDVANYFLTLNNPEAGDAISNLKLQKLCYYAQGFHLAIHGEPLFNEDIQAWQHGPVIPELYHKYKEHGSSGIDDIPEIDLKIYSEEVKELLDEVFKVYGQFSAWKLRDLTHEEPPWKEAFDRCPSSVISHKDMEEHFKTLVIDKD